LIYELIIEFHSYINISCTHGHIQRNPNSIQYFDNQAKIIEHTISSMLYRIIYNLSIQNIQIFSMNDIKVIKPTISVGLWSARCHIRQKSPSHSPN